jgi:hypothetical protein
MKKLLIIAAIATVFASCTKEETLTPSTPKFTAFGSYLIEGTTSYMQLIGSSNSKYHGLSLGTSMTGNNVNADMFFTIQFTDSITFKTIPSGMGRESVYTFIDTNYNSPVVFIKNWNSSETLKLKRIN